MAFLDFLPLIGDAVQGITGMVAQNSANKANMKLAQYAFDRNVEMWNMQNAYNAPEAQMERLKAAGLNPNLVYGSGAVANNSGPTPQFEPAKVAPITDGRFAADAARSAAFTGLQLDNQRQQNELLKTQALAQRQNMLESAARTAETFTRNARSQFDLDLAKELRGYSVDAAKANVAKVWSDIERNDMQNEVSRAELTLIPLRAKISEAQYNSLVTTTAMAAWELQQEKEGRFLGKDIWSVLGNQIVRKLRGEPNMFDSPRELKDNLESELRAKENSSGSSHRGSVDTSGNTSFENRVPKGGV